MVMPEHVDTLMQTASFRRNCASASRSKWQSLCAGVADSKSGTGIKGEMAITRMDEATLNKMVKQDLGRDEDIHIVIAGSGAGEVLRRIPRLDNWQHRVCSVSRK